MKVSGPVAQTVVAASGRRCGNVFLVDPSYAVEGYIFSALGLIILVILTQMFNYLFILKTIYFVGQVQAPELCGQGQKQTNTPKQGVNSHIGYSSPGAENIVGSLHMGVICLNLNGHCLN